MFQTNPSDGTWWYECDGRCGATTQPRANYAPNSGLEGWKVRGYDNLHFCPDCRHRPEIAAIIQEAEGEHRKLFGTEPI